MEGRGSSAPAGVGKRRPYMGRPSSKAAWAEPAAMSVAGSQAQTFLRLLQPLKSRWRSDAALPRTIQSLLAGERRFGSRDRRLYRELIYTTLRYLPWIEPVLGATPAEAIRRIAWLAADTPATKLFRAEFTTGERPSGDHAELLPSWFREHCPELFSPPELDASSIDLPYV